MSTEIRWSRASRDDLKRIDRQQQERIVAAVHRFAAENYGDIKQLHGIENEWRLRVGRFRVRFTRDDTPEGRAILILRVLPRDRAYRGDD